MATDMQPLFNGLPSHPGSALQDARDRQPAFQGTEPSRKFESMLGHAEARQSPAKHEPPEVRNADRPAMHARAGASSRAEAFDKPSDRSAVADPHQQSMDRSERSEKQSEQSTDESGDKDTTQESKKKRIDEDTVSQEIILAAMNVPTAPAAPVEQPPAAVQSGTNDADDAAKAIATIPVGSGAEGPASTPSPAAPIAEGDVAAQALTPREPAAKTEPGQDATQTKDTAAKEPVQTEGKDIPSVSGQIPVIEGRQADRAQAGAAARIDPDHLNPALAALTAFKQEPHEVEPGPIDSVDRSAVLDALAQGTSLSEGQAGFGAGRFMEQDGQSLSDSSGGTDRSLPSQTSSIEQNTRPVFLDRMNGLNQPAPSMNESSSGRSESGQTSAVLRASESQRVNELPGTGPVSHSVMLDLDPLDMGPLRVRVMMSDQTVHAHIRTEHGELGQGLLQQGQSLESSLRTSGLEMGMLRVTVDQQQGRGDNAWMFQQQQQQQGRPPSPNMSQTVTREDERAVRGERGAGSSERVSFFA